MPRKKKKKPQPREKVVYYDDNSTVADMSGTHKKRENAAAKNDVSRKSAHIFRSCEKNDTAHAVYARRIRTHLFDSSGNYGKFILKNRQLTVSAVSCFGYFICKTFFSGKINLFFKLFSR